ncbi:MAG: valine--tRNA ligase [Bdellovibrionota bacterium]
MNPFDIFSRPFNHLQTESKTKKFWESNEFYKSSPNSNKKPYTIVMPPPNVTGDLTMGHMMYTLQDILIRWHRAAGYEACWIPGTDHASIATEAKVTKMLADKGISKKEIGREEFLKHAWQWKEKYGGRIIEAFKSLGISCDWSRLVYTMDDKYSAAVIKALVKLYKDGLVYKSYKLVNWCPVSQSVISDEEVNPEERSGNLWHIRYLIEGESNQFVVVATTRPETLFGDLALAINPTDERFTHLIGKNVVVPICNRVIPVIADNYVEKEFGTGVVKITPAHDMNDFEVGKRHSLGLMNVMNPDATLNEKVPLDYQGLDRFVARKKLVHELEAAGLLDKVTPHKLVIGISERGGVPIEYYLSEQWYIKADKLAQLALNSTRSGKLKLVPSHQEKVWEHWLTNIQDWCISRQLWWGHRLPFYTCTSCKHIHCEETAPVQCEKCANKNLTQDEDVLDTWASSWLWPFGVHNWANPSDKEKQDLEYYYPTDVLVTGADIIFFWVARMAMAGEYFTGKTPFHTCYFTPIIRDAQGRKMSKSLGNSPDIEKIFQTYGTDAMRFSLVNQIATGQDIFWKDSSCEIGKTFANKLWNSARFLTMNAEKLHINPEENTFDKLKNKPQDSILSWIVSEFFAVVAKTHTSIAAFEFSQYTGSLYEFVWMIYCDWFVELIKPRLNELQDQSLAKESVEVGLQIFDGILRLLHPVMPFVTEEIAQNIFSLEGKTLGFAALPTPQPQMVIESSIQSMREVQNVVGTVRTIRGQFNIHPATDLHVYTKNSGEHFGNLSPQMEFLAKAKFHFSTDKNGFCAPAIVNGIELFVSLEGLVDKNAEVERLKQKMDKLTQVIAATKNKLAQSSFVDGAPTHIVEGAKKQLQQNETEFKLLEDASSLLKFI